MNTTKHTSGLALFAAGLLVSATASAANCDKVAADVRAAVEAAPQKVLIIVEDAMAANESCACEIVKAALQTSKANAELARQIVLTATNVAPNLSTLIAECARGVVVASGGKEVKQVMDIQPTAAASSDYVKAPADIRGVYLIQPASGGIVLKDCDCDTKKRPPPKNCDPQSPSRASHH